MFLLVSPNAPHESILDAVNFENELSSGIMIIFKYNTSTLCRLSERIEIMPGSKDSLKSRVLSEMTVDYSKTLEKNFDRAKQFVRISADGMVEVLVRNILKGPEQIQLYLIGKIYAKSADLTATDEVGNKELMQQLAIPEGSLLPWLKELRDKNKISQIRHERNVYHTVPLNLIEETLRGIEKKVKEHSEQK
jgi:hypothetical protein